MKASIGGHVVSRYSLQTNPAFAALCRITVIVSAADGGCGEELSVMMTRSTLTATVRVSCRYPSLHAVMPESIVHGASCMCTAARARSVYIPWRYLKVRFILVEKSQAEVICQAVELFACQKVPVSALPRAPPLRRRYLRRKFSSIHSASRNHPQAPQLFFTGTQA